MGTTPSSEANASGPSSPTFLQCSNRRGKLIITSRSDSVAEKAISMMGCGSKNAASPVRDGFSRKHDDDRCKKGRTTVSSRFELHLRKMIPNKFDMDVIHPVSPPFFGSAFWEPAEEAAPSPGQKSDASFMVHSPTPLSPPSLSVLSSFDDSVILSPHKYLAPSPSPVLRNRSTGDRSTVAPSCSSLYSVAAAPLGSRGDNFDNRSVSKNTIIDDVLVTFTPRILFGDGENQTRKIDIDANGDLINNDGSLLNSTGYYRPNVSRSQSDTSCIKALSIRAMETFSQRQFCGSRKPAAFSSPAIDTCSKKAQEYCQTSIRSLLDDDTSIIIRNGVLVKEKVATPSSTMSSSYSLGSATTQYIPDGVCKSHTRLINTLPSRRSGQPIRLKVTESYAGFSSFSNLDNERCSSSDVDDFHNDFYSYDPYFSSGQYSISTFAGRPYGNELSVKMGPQYMTLQDKAGRVLAVTRSRHSFVPSHILYSPKPRYPNQIPSTHRPNTSEYDAAPIVELYPWVLVRKVGRRIDHDVTMHLVEPPTTDNKSGNAGTQIPLLAGMFNANPSFRSRHGFDNFGSHSHSVVSRLEFTSRSFDSADTTEEKKSQAGGEHEAEEIPCCLILRDPINRDVFDVTIAPGIDPILIICYLAVHAKMDVEPKLSNQ